MKNHKKGNLNPSKSRREREKEQRCKDIMKAAEKLFLKQAFENTTMEQIAFEAEYSKGTLYNYFESKDDLYLSIGIKAHQIMINYTKDFIEKENPGVKQLMAVGFAYYEFAKKHPKCANIFHDIAIKFPDIAMKPINTLTIPEQDYLDQIEEYRKIFLKVLTDAIKNKKIRSDVNPNMIGIALASLTSGLINELSHRDMSLKQTGLEMDQIVDFVFEMIGEGLKPR